MSPRLFVAPYYGGKSPASNTGVAKEILARLPHTRIYVEPCCGMANIFLNKRPVSAVNVLNDADGRIHNLLTVIREEPERLAAAYAATPYSRREYYRCRDDLDAGGAVERARRAMVMLQQGFVHSFIGRHTGFKISYGDRFPRSQATAAESIRAVGRFFSESRVALENRCVLELVSEYIKRQQKYGHDTLFYVDPPYLPDSRSSHDIYGVELTAEQHGELLSMLASARFRVCLSGYDSELYAAKLRGWNKSEVATIACAGRVTIGKAKSARKEVIWTNYDLAQSALALA